MAKKIMVLIVSYNAENTITKLLERIPQEIWSKAKEIIVADDCSSDKTTEVAEQWKKEQKRKNLKVIRHQKNKGYGGNQKWGYEYAMKNKYDIVVMVHGDIQYAPEDIPRLLVPLEKDEADMVFGSRIAGHPLKGGMPLYKFLGNRFLTIVENMVLNQNLTEYHSGFRLYSCNALKKVPFTLCSNNYHFDTQIIIQLKVAKLRIKELPIQTYYGDEKCYVNVIPYGMNILKELVFYASTKFKIKKYKRYDKEYYESLFFADKKHNA